MERMNGCAAVDEGERDEGQRQRVVAELEKGVREKGRRVENAPLHGEA